MLTVRIQLVITIDINGIPIIYIHDLYLYLFLYFYSILIRN